MKRSGLRPMSSSKRRELRERKKLRPAVEAGGCLAQLLVPDVTCAGPLDWDEAKPSGLGGSRTDLANAQGLCRAHHDWAHANPVEAERLVLKIGSGASSDWLQAKALLAEALKARAA